MTTSGVGTSSELSVLNCWSWEKEQVMLQPFRKRGQMSGAPQHLLHPVLLRVISRGSPFYRGGMPMFTPRTIRRVLQFYVANKYPVSQYYSEFKFRPQFKSSDHCTISCSAWYIPTVAIRPLSSSWTWPLQMESGSILIRSHEVVIRFILVFYLLGVPKQWNHSWKWEI